MSMMVLEPKQYNYIFFSPTVSYQILQLIMSLTNALLRQHQRPTGTALKVIDVMRGMMKRFRREADRLILSKQLPKLTVVGSLWQHRQKVWRLGRS